MLPNFSVAFRLADIPTVIDRLKDVVDAEEKDVRKQIFEKARSTPNADTRAMANTANAIREFSAKVVKLRRDWEKIERLIFRPERSAPPVVPPRPIVFPTPERRQTAINRLFEHLADRELLRRQDMEHLTQGGFEFPFPVLEKHGEKHLITDRVYTFNGERYVVSKYFRKLDAYFQKFIEGLESRGVMQMGDILRVIDTPTQTTQCSDLFG